MAGDDSPELDRRRRVNRERVVRTLTFWLRPEFVLRVVNRFQKVAGFDRSIALASAALTATIPLLIVASACLIATRRQGHGRPHHRPLRADGRRRRGGQGHLLAGVGHEHEPWHHRVSLRLGRGPELLPRRAAAVRADLGARARWASATRSTGCSGSAGSGCTPRSAASSTPRWGAAASSSPRRCSPRRCRRSSWSGAAGCSAPSGSSARTSCRSASSDRPCSRCTRLARRCTSRTSSSTYATRYGVIGAVFAMISALFCVMVVVVASAAAGREVHDELDRIQRGERPAEDEVRRQWDQVIGEARSRWETLRAQIQKRRHQHRGD